MSATKFHIWYDTMDIILTYVSVELLQTLLPHCLNNCNIVLLCTALNCPAAASIAGVTQQHCYGKALYSGLNL